MIDEAGLGFHFRPAPIISAMRHVGPSRVRRLGTRRSSTARTVPSQPRPRVSASWSAVLRSSVYWVEAASLMVLKGLVAGNRSGCSMATGPRRDVHHRRHPGRGTSKTRRDPDLRDIARRCSVSRGRSLRTSRAATPAQNCPCAQIRAWPASTGRPTRNSIAAALNAAGCAGDGGRAAFATPRLPDVMVKTRRAGRST